MSESDNVVWGRFGHGSHESAPRREVVDRQLSEDIIERLAVPFERQASMRFAAWSAHIEIDMSALGNVQFNPEAFWFITRPLRHRYALATPILSKLYIDYLVEKQSPEVIQTASDLAMEVAVNFQLHPAAIDPVVINPRSDPTKPYSGPPHAV